MMAQDAGRSARGPRGGDGSATPWLVLAGAVVALISLPIVAVVGHLFVPSGGIWPQLIDTVLPLYLRNTLLLAALVAAGAIVIGVATGWLVATCDFPGRRVFEWALMLPMAMPGYVIAYVAFDRLSYWGPVQSGLRTVFSWGRDDYWFPEIASLPGAAVLLALVLYPYVYLLSRVAFLRQSARLIEAARALGAGPFEAFRRVALPIAWPAVAGGGALVVMETIADYGTVLHLGVQTLSTGIFRTWFARGSPVGAAQLAALLLGIAVLAYLAERRLRGRRRFAADPSGRAPEVRRVPLSASRGLAAAVLCAVPVLLGFVLPAAELLRLAVVAGDPLFGVRFAGFALNSLGMAAATAALLVVVAVLIVFARRIRPGRLATAAIALAGLGYALPGAVIALGVLLPLAAFDRGLDALMRGAFGVSTGLLLTGSVAALFLAYAVRFLAGALQSVEAAFARVPPSYEEAARALGATRAEVLWRIHLPVVRGGLLSAAIFVFADVMKELPATLILRPFDFETLAVRVFRLASDGRLEQASTAALAIVAVGILPVILLSRAMNR
jgi:iron(III) transport system permease protein